MLNLPLKKYWFEEIQSGRKTVEYRKASPYWANRFEKLGPGSKISLSLGYTAPRLVSFYNSLGLEGHNGLDFCPIERRDYRLRLRQQVPDDLYVRSPLDFELVYAAPDYRNGAGAYVKGRCCVHGKEHFIYFFHLNEWMDQIKIAGRVKAGQIVGVMGGSGNGQQYAFAPHLHLQLRPLDGNQANGYQGAIDPSFLLN